MNLWRNVNQIILNVRKLAYIKWQILLKNRICLQNKFLNKINEVDMAFVWKPHIYAYINIRWNKKEKNVYKKVHMKNVFQILHKKKNKLEII